MLFSFVVDSVLYKAVFKEQEVIVLNRNGGSTLLGEVLAVFHIVVVKCHFYLRSGPVNYNASQINGFCRPAEVVRIVSAKRVQPLLLQRQVSVIGVGFFLSDPLESGNIQPDRCFFVYLIFNHNILGRKERVGDCNANGNISVYQGLSGNQYDRIYLMLGANDLGYYPWENFLPEFEGVLKQFHELQPHAIIYVCSVIYVDESKIAAGFEYDNNENVRTINGYILQACEDLWYSYYLNLNEIFSDGYGSLISDASSDGIHLYAPYLENMLKYLKNHYITDEAFAAETAKHPDDIANAGAQQDTEVEAAAEEQPSDLVEEVSAN